MVLFIPRITFIYWGSYHADQFMLWIGKLLSFFNCNTYLYVKVIFRNLLVFSLNTNALGCLYTCCSGRMQGLGLFRDFSVCFIGV